MMQSYSIAQARDKFAAIVHEVEHSSSIEVTRRGKPIAVIISVEEYERLHNGKQDFWDAVVEFRNSIDWETVDIGPKIFDDVRAKTSGREGNPWLDSY